MKYQAQNQNGDAAEYFVAFKFTSLFGWPFRLYGVDLGIDGEFEIQDDEETSTGNIVKVQIKSVTGQSSPEGQRYIYPSDKQIEYWKTFCSPVVMCAVDLVKQEVYWTQISETNAYVSPKGKARIAFDPASDLLSTGSASSLRSLVTPPDAHRLREILDNLHKTIAEVVDEYGNIAEPVGLIAGGKFQDLAATISGHIDSANELAKYYPWKLSLSDRALLKTARDVGRSIRQRGDEAVCDHFG